MHFDPNKGIVKKDDKVISWEEANNVISVTRNKLTKEEFKKASVVRLSK